MNSSVYRLIRTCVASVTLVVASWSGGMLAADTAAKAKSPATVIAPETLKLLRQDAELWKARAAELANLSATAKQKVESTTAALKPIRQQLEVVNKDAAEAQAALKLLVPKAPPAAPPAANPKSAPEKKSPAADRPAATKGTPAARTAVIAAPPAKGSPVPAVAPADPVKVAAAKARLQEVSERQKTIRRELTLAEQNLKQAETARDALNKSLAEAESLEKQARQRLDLLAKTPQTAKPENTRLLQTFTAPRSVLVARWDRAGRGFYAGVQGSDVLQYDLYQSTAPMLELKGHHSWIGSLEVAPRDPLLVSAAYNGHLIWWNTAEKNPELTKDVLAHRGFVRAVAFSPDGRYLASCGNDQVVRVWSAHGVLVKELQGHASHVYNVAFHPSGRYLVSGDLMGHIRQWDTITWQQAREIDATVLEKYDEVFYAHCGGIRSIDFSPDGRQLVVSGVSEVTNAFAGIAVPTAVLFDFETGKRLKVMKPQNPADGSCWGVRFSPAGDFIVGAGGRGSGSLWFWKPTEEKSFFDVRLPNVPYDVEFHPDGFRLLLPMYDSTIRVYDLGPKSEVATTTTAPPAKK